MLADYTSCQQCGEYRKAALRKSAIGLCLNCADQKHRKGSCWVCRKNHLPLERHHFAGRKHAALTVPICLNCHALLSRRQYEWPDLWRGEPCVAFLFFGLLDYSVLSIDPAMPYELLSEQCEEMKEVVVDKAAAALIFLSKIIWPVILLALFINLMRPSVGKPKE
ncbi:hypothetical protein [Nitrosomonas communis]|uniref:Uncharacterized protein n=1 Tax=Nitrosomonas communis TaxID=44574 RepID=A0A1I4UDC3_9PROT|nr:hypothetical protein [Nitrosomonas communis]SFM86979.1 hypothetical protein SAMN05421863_10638 [Nitrosomonas communis]